jgi:hypothetical protein
MKGYIPDPKRIEVMSDEMVEALRQMTIAERVEMGMQLTRIARAGIENELRSSHPDWSDMDIAAGVARRWMDGNI